MSDQRYIRRVQALLDRAGHPTTPEAERDECLNKAKMLMEQHRIDQALLNEHRSEEEKRGDVECREYRLEDHFEYMGDQRTIMRAVFATSGCKIRSHWNGVEAVGYTHDLDVAEMLWLNIQAHFLSRLFPKWDQSLSKDENIYRIKSAGYSWMDVVNMSPEDSGLNKNSGSYMRSAFKREAAKRGLENVQHSRTPAKYRTTFSEAYASRLHQRLHQMQREAESSRDESKSLAIIKDESFLEEELYRLFPQMRPKPEEEIRAAMAAREEAERQRREAMTESQRRAEDAKREREDERWRRRMERESVRNRPDRLGWQNGFEAANSVSLSTAEAFDVKEKLAR